MVKRGLGLVVMAALAAAVAACGSGGRPAPTVAVATLGPTWTPAPTATARPTPTWVPLPSPPPTPEGGVPTRASVPRVGVAQARALAKEGEALLVDVRPRGSYEQAHIAGAASMPADEVAARHQELPPDRLVIFYCA